MAYNDSRKSRRRRRRRMKIIQAVLPVVIAVVLIVIIAVVGWTTGLFDSFTYSSKKADLNTYFQVMSQDTATVVDNGEFTTERIAVKEGRLYSELDTVRDKYNCDFYYETATGRLLYTNQNGVYSISPNSTQVLLNGSGEELGYIACYTKGETIMVCLDYVRRFANFEYNLFGGGNEPYRTQIKTQWGENSYCNVTKDDRAVRIEPDKQSDILKEVNEGTKLLVLGAEGEDWMKVQTEDLFIGYFEKKFLSDVYTENETPIDDVAPINVPTVADYTQPVILAWHNVTNEASAQYLSDYSKYLSSINTISPTWFALSDDNGTVASIASHDYVNMCHEKGIKVWGLVDNMTYPEVSTYNVMSDPDKRASVISQLLTYASEYNLDGINVDFEMVTEDAGPHFVQFVRELSLAAHKQNLVISVDNYVPKGYTAHYNRKAQGLFADYVIIMGYDEHTSGSDEAGSVASINFVLDGIEQTIAEVAPQKVVNGIPFYTRYWTVGGDGNIIDMQTLPMDKAKATVANSGAEITWDEETNQNYAEWGSNGTINKIWLEDAQSIRSKLEVMTNKNIGGVAVWQLAYSDDSAWEVINEYYRP